MPTTPANGLNIKTAGIVGFDGSSAFSGSPMTQYEVVLGGASTDTLDLVSGLGTTGQILTSNGPSAAPTWQTGGGSLPDPNTVLTLVDDFTGWNFEGTNIIDSSLPWITDVTNPFNVAPSSINTNPGVITHPTIVSGVSYLYLGQGGQNPTFVVGAGEITLEWIFNVVTPPDNTNNYQIFLGFVNNTSTFTSWAAMFVQDLNGPWKNSNNNNTSSSGTAQPGPTITSGWHKGIVNINAAGTSVTYTIDGVSNTIASNVPGLPISPVFYVSNKGGTVAAGSVIVDLFTLTQTLTVSR